MKRIIPFLLTASLVIASCDEQVVELEVETRVKPVDTEFIDGQPTVYAISSDTAFAWTPGDSISVLESNGSSYAFKTFVTSGSGRRAMFIGPVLEAGWQMTGAALYPAAPGNAYDGGSFSFELPSVFREDAGSVPLPMLSGAFSQKGTLGFSPIGGLLALSLSGLEPGAYYSACIEGTADLTGIFSISADGAEVAPTVKNGGKQQSVTVLADADGNATAFFPLVAGNYGTVEASVFASSGKKSWGGSISGVKIAAGSVVSKSVAVPKILTPQQALGSLSDWASVANVYGASNTYGGIPDFYNSVSGEPSPVLEVKFRSDEDFLFGYIKIDTTRFIYRYQVMEDEVLVDKKISGPASSVNNFTVWADNDEVDKDQSVYVGHWWHYTGYDLMIRGAACSSCKPKDWKPSLRRSCEADGSIPVYGGNAFGTAVEPAPTDIGFGNGVLNDGILEFQFAVSRDALGIAGKSSAHIGLSFDEGWAGWSAYSLIPDVNGFDITF